MYLFAPVVVYWHCIVYVCAECAGMKCFLPEIQLVPKTWSSKVVGKELLKEKKNNRKSYFMCGDVINYVVVIFFLCLPPFDAHPVRASLQRWQLTVDMSRNKHAVPVCLRFPTWPMVGLVYSQVYNAVVQLWVSTWTLLQIHTTQSRFNIGLIYHDDDLLS